MFPLVLRLSINFLRRKSSRKGGAFLVQRRYLGVRQAPAATLNFEKEFDSLADCESVHASPSFGSLPMRVRRLEVFLR